MPGPEDNQVGPITPSEAATVSSTTDVERGPDAPLPPPPPPPHQQGGCCKNRSLLEKCLLVFLLIIFLLFIAFLIGFILLYFWKEEDREFCTQSRCVQSAARVSAFVDKNQNPCDDFYQYACGKWLSDNVIPEHAREVTVYTQLQDNAKVILKKQLEDKEILSNIPAVEKSRIFFSSCMNEEKIEEAGLNPFEKLVSQVGQWPSLEPNWNDTDFELEDVLIHLSRKGHNPLIKVNISADADGLTAHTVFIGQASLDLRREDYLNGRSNKKIRAYQDFLTRLLLEFGVDVATAKEDAEQIVDFAIQLANITDVPATEEIKRKTYKVTSIDELEKKYPKFDWRSYINGLLQYGDAPQQLTGTDAVINTSPGFFDKLFPLLDNTPKRVLANYLMSSLNAKAKHLSRRLRQILHDFKEVIYGTRAHPHRWRYCIDFTEAVFPEPTGRLFVESSFGQAEKTAIEDLIRTLQVTFLDTIRQAEWMSFSTKEIATEKARAMKASVGYPSNVMDNSYLDNKYAEYNVTKESFFDNVLRVAYLENQAEVSKLRTAATGKASSKFTASATQAYYSPQTNELVFPAGFVQPPIFDTAYSSSMIYGGIGSYIAREITHGFDEIGRHYDKEGRARQWWSIADEKQFLEQAQCLVDHYSCFRWKPAKANIDGLLTLHENIADNGGLKQSFRAYRLWVEKRGIEERLLPGLNLTHNQLFFISFAQLWCTNDLDELKIEKIKTSSFAPEPYRVLGTLQNSEEFATAFKCQLGSRMNPEKKCKVW